MVHRPLALLFAALLVTIPVSVAAQPAPVDNIVDAKPARPFALAPMYVSLAGLQTYDTYSTLRVLKQGGVEANPLMAGIVKRPAALVTVKGVTTVASIYMAERLWRSKRRKSAVMLMVVINGMMAVVAANNSSTLRKQR